MSKIERRIRAVDLKAVEMFLLDDERGEDDPGFDICDASLKEWQDFVKAGALFQARNILWKDGKLYMVELSSGPRGGFISMFRMLILGLTGTGSSHLQFADDDYHDPVEVLHPSEPDISFHPMPRSGAVRPPGLRFLEYQTLKVEVGVFRSWKQLRDRVDQWIDCPGLAYILCSPFGRSKRSPVPSTLGGGRSDRAVRNDRHRQPDHLTVQFVAFVGTSAECTTPGRLPSAGCGVQSLGCHCVPLGYPISLGCHLSGNVSSRKSTCDFVSFFFSIQKFTDGEAKKSLLYVVSLLVNCEAFTVILLCRTGKSTHTTRLYCIIPLLAQVVWVACVGAIAESTDLKSSAVDDGNSDLSVGLHDKRSLRTYTWMPIRGDADIFKERGIDTELRFPVQETLVPVVLLS